MCIAIVIGSSPSVRQGYPLARDRWPDALTVTCNRGLQIEPNPDFYFLSDMLACQLWAEDARQASKRGKTQRVTLRRDPQAMKTRSVGDFEVVIREGHPYEPFQLSGWWCVEFAVRMLHARTVVLVGMDGYEPNCQNQDYFAGAYHHAPNDGLQKDLTRTVVEPLGRRVVTKYPQVSFVILGAPWYTINSKNFTLVPLSR